MHCWPRGVFAGRLAVVNAIQLDESSAFECTAEGDLVGVLKISTDRQTTCEARNRDPQRSDHPGQVGSGCFALEVGISRKNDFGDSIVGKPGKKLSNSQIVRTDAIDQSLPMRDEQWLSRSEPGDYIAVLTRTRTMSPALNVIRSDFGGFTLIPPGRAPEPPTALAVR